MDGQAIQPDWLDEITNEGGGEGPGCLMALGAVAVAVVVGGLLLRALAGLLA